MKEILVLSGKGGTGKTSVTGSMAYLASRSARCVVADCDVDSADLHLIMSPVIQEEYDFYGSKTAEIDQDICTACGECLRVCRFSAITEKDGKFEIDSLSCEGCNVCAWICPVNAIQMKDSLDGRWFVSKTAMGPLVHAELGVSGENSGKLVSVIRRRAKEEAGKIGADYLILDGSPGIGCPVIASMTGVDFVLLVTEPSVSGIHDLKRIAELIGHFGIKAGVVVNRCDVNAEKTGEILKYAQEKNLEVFGQIPFDREMVKAQMAGKAIVEYSDGKTAEIIISIWERICRTI